jgi:hypothetical protein
MALRWLPEPPYLTDSESTTKESDPQILRHPAIPRLPQDALKKNNKSNRRLESF